MFKVTELVHLVADADPATSTSLAARLHEVAASRARSVLATPTLPGGINGGDLMVHLHFDDESHWRAAESEIAAVLCVPEVGHVDSVAYTGVATPARGDGPPTVYRTLLVAVDDAVDPAVVERFEAETRAMPQYIRTIGASQLSRVHESGGSARWTHVWEQEYANVGGLLGPYMTHPYHWAHIDRWFDPERGPRIVTRLCHSFCAIDGTTISPLPAPRPIRIGPHSP
ncbi:Dabb family protein [Rhodococcus jostii]|uniref:Stress responsive A/B Barrel Domain n=1 Tax=Rhodococcus jostii TaxID=132919 RepID=A0A1H5GGX5_RHOJO|nr:Dabb family protein [Rhodococcus jostii]SEE15016.1 Stress responsive A/B Barrel Domain [Rhodococcus jostii]